MKNCLDLDIKCHPLKKEFILPEFLEKRKVYAYGIECLSLDFINWCTVVGLQPEKILLFVDPGVDNIRRIHIDGLGDSAKLFSINWNLKTNGVIMEWFSVLGDYNLMYSPYPYRFFPEENCKLIESSNSLGPVLFNTSVPHSVMNVDGGRYGLTIRFSDKITYKEAVQILSKWIK